MIKCPKCKGSNLIMEQPSWHHTDNPADEYIEVQSNCCDCHVDFTTKHKLGKTLKVYDVEENKAYSF